MQSERIKVVCLGAVLLMIALALLPPVSGDGCPAYYSYYGVDDEEARQKAFSSVFETRQLAVVEYKTSTMQRISLFLSVYTLDPGKNMSILVPLRTLPTSVSGEPIKEDEYREEFQLDQFAEVREKQDTTKAKDRLESGVKTRMAMMGGALIWTYPAEYTRQNIKKQSSGGKGYDDDEGTMGGNGGGEYGKEDEPQPIQKYEFDGFSIEVYGVTAGPTLKEHLENKGMVLPDSVIFDAYMDQYVAVIESEAKAPIDNDKFAHILEYAPETLQFVMDRNRANPKMSGWQREEFMDQVYNKMDHEYNDIVVARLNEDPYYNVTATEDDVYNAFATLVNAIFGETNFDGEVVHMDVPMDNGKMYFPLGTSGGWPNAVGEIDVMFKVPENKRLAIQNSTDAYFDGSHYHLFHMENANPAFDLESRVMDADLDRKSDLERAAFINDNWKGLALGINLGAMLVMYFGTGAGVKFMVENRRKRKKGEKKTNWAIKDPQTWLLLAVFLGLSFIISIPGALIVYFLFKPMKVREIKNHVVPLTLLILYPISLAFLLMGVML